MDPGFRRDDTRPKVNSDSFPVPFSFLYAAAATGIGASPLSIRR
jgi:hypothetical protein